MEEVDYYKEGLLRKSKRDEEEEDNRSERKWWNKIMDMKEAKEQILFSLPMILTNVFYYMIPLVSVMFAGHIGQLELAGATLANSWAYVTGYAFMVGLSGALETLCGQGYGAKKFNLMGIQLQAACITTLMFSLIISIIWFFTEPILILLHQDPLIAKSAALYMKYLIPSVFAYGLIQNILRFLQTQSVVTPLVLFSGIPLLLHVGFTYSLVNFTSLGFAGAPLAASITLWISFLLLFAYVSFSAKFRHTWLGFSAEAFCHVFDNLRLAIPSAAMVCLEYWAFEILVFLAGLMPNAEISTSLIAICVNTEAIAFNVVYGLSAAASTRVSNELGADDPKKAKSAMFVSLKLSGFLALIVVTALGFGHDLWVGSFTDSSEIIDSFASMTPLLVISIIIDSFQGVLSGVARGCGWQHIAVGVNLAMFYLVGMTVAALLAFKAKLYTKGLWLGLICGLGCQAATLMVITMRIKWTKLTLSERTKNDDPLLT